MEVIENTGRYSTELDIPDSASSGPMFMTREEIADIYPNIDISENLPEGRGLYQQMAQGNRVPYQELTRERIEEVFMELFYNRSNNPDRRININLTQSQQDVFWQEMNPEPNIKISEIHFPF